MRIIILKSCRLKYSLVDQRGAKGQFILTAFSTPNHKGILHSGAGRIAKLRMRPMSLYESGDSSGKVSLESNNSTKKLILSPSPKSIFSLTSEFCINYHKIRHGTIAVFSSCR